MCGEFELIYYCHLNDEFALEVFIKRFNKYIWKMIHYYVYKDNHKQILYDSACYELMISLVYSISLTRTVNFKGYFSTTIVNGIRRMNARLDRIERCCCSLQELEDNYGLDTFNQLADCNDPQLMDDLNHKVNRVMNIIHTDLSRKQRQAIDYTLREEVKYAFKNKKEYQNALYQARKKIKQGLD